MAEEKIKKKTEEVGDEIGRERGKSGEDAQVKKKSKKQRFDSETEDDGKKLKKSDEDKRIDSGADDFVKEKSKKKKKNKEIKVDSELENGVKEKSKKKKNKEKMVDSEAEDGVKEKSKKKKKKSKKESEVDVIGNSERSQVCEKPLVDTDDANKKKGKRKRDESDLGAEENSEDKEMKRKSKKKKPSVDSESDGNNKDSVKDAKKEKKKKAKQSVDSEVEENNKDSTKDAKKQKKKKKAKHSVDSVVEETSLNSTDDANKENKPSEDSEVEENNKDSKKDAKKEKKKKTKQSVDSEVEETSLNSTDDANKESKQSEDSEVEENNNDSTKDAKKQKKKKKAKHRVDSEVEDVNLKSTENAKKKSKTKKQSEDSEAEGNDLNSTKDSKKKRKQSKVSEVEENSKDAKKKSKGKKRNEDSVADENNNDATKVAKKKRKTKQESGKSDKDVATPSSKSTKRVKFSDQLEVFESEDNEEEAKLVRGKRYSKEEDELVKGSVLEYIENHALGDDGVKMIMECKSHPQLKGCWKEISSAIPWRTLDSVYNRAHTLFEEGSRGVWRKEDLDLVREFQKKHGNDWRTLADAMGKHRKHVKDAWRRIRLTSKNKGHWMREEYQALFDLVNKDIRMKAFQEKRSKHGMLRDNIPWMAISDGLGSRDHVTCCSKWYEQLQSPMITKGIWANVDDYRLLEELLKLDAACIDDVDWDNLLDNRDEEACRKRWNQMVLYLGSPRSKTFAEQVEILSQRYCPELAEDREDFDNRPFDPKD